jgi:hypothetical protein
MDPQIDALLCGHCRPIVAAALEVERTQLAAKLARDKLRALSDNKPKTESETQAPQTTKIKVSAKANPPVAKPSPAVTATAADPFKGKRNSTWKDVPVSQVLKNIRGDVAPHQLCEKLGIATSVLRRRVQDIIGMPDDGRRWQKGIGYIVKGKPAWDHDRDVLRVDKTKGVAMAALEASKGKAQSKTAVAGVGGRGPKPGPSDAEVHAYLEGKLNVAKLMRRYKCGKGKIYKAIDTYKVRFGADAPHGEPRAINGNGASSQANGIISAAAHSAAH